MAREIARSIAPSRAGEPNGVIELPAVMGRKKADGAQDARGARGGALNRGSSAPEIPQTVGDHGASSARSRNRRFSAGNRARARCLRDD
jgi:hypothetical protein